MTTGKTIALTRWTFVDKVMSLLFNMLSRMVTTLPPRSKRLLISWLQSQSAVILEPPKIKFLLFFTLLFHFHKEAKREAEKQIYKQTGYRHLSQKWRGVPPWECWLAFQAVFHRWTFTLVNKATLVSNTHIVGSQVWFCSYNERRLGMSLHFPKL